MTRSRTHAALAALAVAVVLSLAACGSSSSSSSPASPSAASSTTTDTVHFAKTKFVFHSALAFGAFHRYIYKPLRAGDFRHPFTHKLTILKAGLAGAFVYHEVKLALHDAQADPTLSKLVAPITALQNRLHDLPTQASSGNAAAIGSDNGAIGAIESQAAGTGRPILEQIPAHL